MNKITTILLAIGIIALMPLSAHAQMMRTTTPSAAQPSVSPSSDDVEDIQSGKELFAKFQNKQISCSGLHDDDFDKIGEYLMDQSFGGNTNVHIQMNTAMKQMMGDQGEEQMHIRLAENATGCLSGGQGSVGGMMGNWGWTGGMMGGNWIGASGFFGSLFWGVAFIDLILLGIFLLRRLGKK